MSIFKYGFIQLLEQGVAYFDSPPSPFLAL